MAYTLDVNLALGAGNAGLTLEMQLKSTTGVNVGSAVTAGFVDLTLGNYLFHYAGWPDGHRGVAVFQVSPGGAVKAAVAINAEEFENTDIKTSTVAALSATAVWAVGTRTLTGFGSLVADVAAAVWSYVSRTLTMSSAQIASAVAGSEITIQRGDTLSAALTDIGSLTGRTKLWFTVKTADDDADTAAFIQIEETAGLVRLNGAAGTAGQGSITVTDAPTGDLTIALAAAATAQLSAGRRYRYDIQILTASGVTTRTQGICRVSADVTRAVS